MSSEASNSISQNATLTTNMAEDNYTSQTHTDTFTISRVLISDTCFQTHTQQAPFVIDWLLTHTLQCKRSVAVVSIFIKPFYRVFCILGLTLFTPSTLCIDLACFGLFAWSHDLCLFVYWLMPIPLDLLYHTNCHTCICSCLCLHYVTLFYSSYVFNLCYCYLSYPHSIFILTLSYLDSTSLWVILHESLTRENDTDLRIKYCRRLQGTEQNGMNEAQ